MRISFAELQKLLSSILLKNGFNEKNADLLALLLSENTLSGVASHGVNRFAALIKLVNTGHIIPNAEPIKINSFGAWEQWDAKFGAGPLNAWRATDRAIELSKQFGVACVTLKNSNHWMRPGAYGWKAAEAGHILICWTNTIPIMIPWQAKESKIGNNPITLAVPRKNGHVVVDMALSQYSYGKLSTMKREGKELEYPGGFDKDGNLSKDAAAIYESNLALPIGYWKGAGLAILFDLIAALLSGGLSTNELGKSNIDTGMSQVFICFDPSKSLSSETLNRIADEIIESVKTAQPMNNDSEVLYPGERVLITRQNNLKYGIEIHDEIWDKIQQLV